jgi:hypothetical protein
MYISLLKNSDMHSNEGRNYLLDVELNGLFRRTGTIIRAVEAWENDLI